MSKDASQSNGRNAHAHTDTGSISNSIIECVRLETQTDRGSAMGGIPRTRKKVIRVSRRHPRSGAEGNARWAVIRPIMD